MFPLLLYEVDIHHIMITPLLYRDFREHYASSYTSGKKSLWDYVSRKEPITARMLKIWRKI